MTTNGKAGPITVAALQMENAGMVKAFNIELSPKGLTIIGGDNKQGKTTVLRMCSWLFGGGKNAPANPNRKGAMNPATLSATLSNGIVVERTGKNGTLRVLDPTGAKHGQALLDSFVSQFALDLPKFMNASDKEKAGILLQVLGIGDKLTELERKEKALCDERLYIGRNSEAKTKYAQELPEFADAPDEPVSASDLIREQQTILARNGENERKRTQLGQILAQREQLQGAVARLREQLADAEAKLAQTEADYLTAQKSAMQLVDESTAEIETSLENIETINSHVRANMEKSRALDEATELQAQYNAKTVEIEAVRAARLALLNGADLPLPGLTVEDNTLLYNGFTWGEISGSDQLTIAAAIVRKLQPNFAFLLMDKLEAYDLETLRTFNAWLEAEGLQVLATRVSTGPECSIIIEDGLPKGVTYAEAVTPIPAAQPVSNYGEF